MSKMRNVFISHRHEDDALVGKLKGFIQGRGFEIRDSSITSDRPNRARNPDYIKTDILAPKIRWAGTMIVLITPDTKNHDWVDWEIEYANKRDKQIIGVWAYGSAGCELPESLDKYADAVVGWNKDRIIRALEGERLFDNPDGTARGPQPLKRHPC